MNRFCLKLYIAWKNLVAARELHRLGQQAARNLQLSRKVEEQAAEIVRLRASEKQHQQLLLYAGRATRRLQMAMEQVAGELSRTGREDPGAVIVAMQLACDPDYLGTEFLLPFGQRPPKSRYRRAASTATN